MFTIKPTPKGTQLVAKGYNQTYGIDYDEIFAPVAKMTTIRTLISLIVNKDGTIQTVGKVRRVRKSLHGLMQSPQAWFDRLRRVFPASRPLGELPKSGLWCSQVRDWFITNS